MDFRTRRNLLFLFLFTYTCMSSVVIFGAVYNSCHFERTCRKAPPVRVHSVIEKSKTPEHNLSNLKDVAFVRTRAAGYDSRLTRIDRRFIRKKTFSRKAANFPRIQKTPSRKSARPLSETYRKILDRRLGTNNLATRNRSNPDTLDILTRANVRKVSPIFPGNASLPLTLTSAYIIPNRHVCKSVVRLKYIIVVSSAPGNFDKRQSLRDTWAQNAGNYMKDTDSRTIFLLGRTVNSKEIELKIFEENARYKDIVLGNFVDSYTNLTLKAVMGLRWVSENCQNAKFVLKTDDDAIINVFQVKTIYFPILSQNPKQILCSVEPQLEIIRDPRFPKYVPNYYFKGLSHYPMPICHGFAVFLTSSLVVELFQAAKTTPFFHLDDVYVYGILASKVNGISWRKDNSKFELFESGTLRALESTHAGVVESHKMVPLLWTLMTERHKNAQHNQTTLKHV